MSGALRLRQLNVGNLSASNSAITATTTNSDITLTANGTGEVKIGDTTASTSTSVVTRGYADSIYAGITTAQTLTNKTILTGTVRATQIQNVVISGTNPVAGQFLVATGATSGAWSNIVDSTTVFADETDNTKRMQLQLSSVSTGTIRTLTVPDNSGTIALTSDITASMLVNKSSQQLIINQGAGAYTPSSSNDAISTCLFSSNTISDLQFVNSGASAANTNEFVGATTTPSGSHSLAGLTNIINTNSSALYLTFLSSGTYRMNAYFQYNFKLSKLNIGFISTSAANVFVNINGYTSAQSATFPMGGGTQLLVNHQISGVNSVPIDVLVNATTAYSYYGVSINRDSTTGVGQPQLSYINFYDIADTVYVPLSLGTDYTRSVDGNGYPAYTLVAPPKEVTYNQGNLAVQELYNRIYPVIRDTKTIKLKKTVDANFSQIYLNTDGTKQWSIGAYDTAFQIWDEATRFSRLGVFLDSIFLNTVIRIMTNTTILQNHVLKCTTTGSSNIFTPSFLNIQEMADYNTAITKTNNDILTYNTTTSKWEPKDIIILGTNNSVKLGESAVDTFKLSSVNTTYGTVFNYTSSLWKLQKNNGLLEISGNNTGTAQATTYNIKLDADTPFTLASGATANNCTQSLNCFSTNSKWTKSRAHWDTGIVFPASGSYQALSDGTDHIIVRTSGGSSDDVALPLSSTIFPGFTVVIIMTTGTQGTITPHASDTTAMINGTLSSVLQTQDTRKDYMFIGTTGTPSIPRWYYIP